MNFGEVALDSLAIDAVLAHSLKTDGGRLRKGTRLTADLIHQLKREGLTHVIAAKLDAGDVHEDAAAAELAQALAGDGVRLGRARTGRVNLHAEIDGLVEFDRQIVDRINRIDESITVATLLPSSMVARGRLVATVKIIPYAVRRESLDEVSHGLAKPIRVQARRACHAVLIQTRLPGVRDSVLDKTVDITQERLLKHGAKLSREIRTEHQVGALGSALDQAIQSEPHSDWLMIIGASAIADRRDVIPEAIERLGGRILRYGLPMDPGNLLLLGRLKGRFVIGLPGCARSPKPNGLDVVLQRLSCALPLDDDWIATLGVGGLLQEIVDRPLPRESLPAHGCIAALVLAAGSSNRFGAQNKLLARYRNLPLLSSVLQALDASLISNILVVTGHDAETISALCDQHDRQAATPTRRIHNFRHASGMAASLLAGVAELSAQGVEAILVCLGDMPEVSAGVINTLIAAWHTQPGKAMYIPVHAGQRGNPVIITSSLFDSVLQLEGDVGARVLARQFPDCVLEVDCGSDVVLKDVDRPSDLVL